MSYWEDLSSWIPVSFFTAVPEVPQRPLGWRPLARSLSPSPSPLNEMLVLPLSWGSCNREKWQWLLGSSDGFGKRLAAG